MCGFHLPRDPDGEIVPHDHPDLVEEARLIRRIHSAFVVEGQEAGSKRLSSAVFKHNSKSGHLSFDSETCIVGKGLDPAEYVCDPKFFGALAITVGELRAINAPEKEDDRWKLGLVPVDGNECHSGLWGKVTTGKSNSIQKASAWLVEIPGVAKLT